MLKTKKYYENVLILMDKRYEAVQSLLMDIADSKPSLRLSISVPRLQSRAVGRLHSHAQRFQTIAARKPLERRTTPIQWEGPEEFHTVSTATHPHTDGHRTVLIKMCLPLQWCEAGVGQVAGWAQQTTAR